MYVPPPKLEAVQNNAPNPLLGGQFDFSQIGFQPEHVQFQGRLTLADVEALLPYLTPDETRELALLLEAAEKFRAKMPHQIVPWHRDDWEIMALNGGRGVGKTQCGSDACLEYLEHVKTARVGIGAPTIADVRDTCLEGVTGLMTLYGHQFRDWKKSQLAARHKNGGWIKGMGTEKPGRWNGPQWSFLWFDEASLCNPKAITDAMLGLRLGPKEGPFRARALFTMTPKGQKWIEQLLHRPNTYVPYYIGLDGKPRFPTTFDNPHLPARRGMVHALS